MEILNKMFKYREDVATKNNTIFKLAFFGFVHALSPGLYSPYDKIIMVMSVTFAVIAHIIPEQTFKIKPLPFVAFLFIFLSFENTVFYVIGMLWFFITVLLQKEEIIEYDK